MNSPLYQLTPWEEHQFWLEIIQDHAYFLFEALSPSEQHWINITCQYIAELGKLLTKLKQLDRFLPAGSDAMIQFAREATPIACHYYQLDGHIGKLRIENQININLTPTYFNGTLNEEQEYVRMLQYYVRGEDPPPLSMDDLINLWLEDQQGHALLLVNLLDPTEVLLRKHASTYLDTFTALLSKQKQYTAICGLCNPISRYSIILQKKFLNRLMVLRFYLSMLSSCFEKKLFSTIPPCAF